MANRKHRSRLSAALLATGLILASVGVAAQAEVAPPVVSKECGEPGIADRPLPNSATALQQRKRIKILAIGASSTAVLGMGRNRGFSGELADAAGERIRIEVALNQPDIVLWQVGTNDAFAQVSVADFEASVVNTVRWLKEHNVDVILVGLQYAKSLAKDAHYQAIRMSLRRVALAENVLRIGRYESMEVLARTMASDSGRPELEDFGLTEAGFNCMAQYIARTITVGIFAKPPKHTPAPEPGK
jgi:acyl-CoA thioesterase I